jgi:hypothetical protein
VSLSAGGKRPSRTERAIESSLVGAGLLDDGGDAQALAAGPHGLDAVGLGGIRDEACDPGKSAERVVELVVGGDEVALRIPLVPDKADDAAGGAATEIEVGRPNLGGSLRTPLRGPRCKPSQPRYAKHRPEHPFAADRVNLGMESRATATGGQGDAPRQAIGRFIVWLVRT